MPLTPSPPLDLLALSPHPDDVELSCGGWLALTAQRGQRAAILDLTRGEAATNGTPAERAAEAAAAAAALGVPRLPPLDLPDGGLRAGDPHQLAALVRAIRAYRPRLLLAPWVQDRHPDHSAAGALAEQAAFLAGVRNHAPELGAPHRPARVVFYPQRHEVIPSFVVDVTAVYAAKQAAIAAHASQFGGGGEPTLINAPLGLQAWAVRDRYWGASVGVAHGEPYLIRAPMPLADPLALADGPLPVLVPSR